MPITNVEKRPDPYITYAERGPLNHERYFSDVMCYNGSLTEREEFFCSYTNYNESQRLVARNMFISPCGKNTTHSRWPTSAPNNPDENEVCLRIYYTGGM